MISGALLLHKKMEDEKDVIFFYKHNFLPLVIVTELWYIIMYFPSVMQKGMLDSLTMSGLSDLIIGFFKTILFIDPITLGSMWYMPMILGMYSLIPFFNLAFSKLNSKKVILLPLCLLFLSAMLFSDLNFVLPLFGLEDYSFHFVIHQSYLISMYFVYLFIGYFISEGILKRLPNKNLIFFFSILFVVLSLFQLFAYSREANYLVSYESPLLLICSLLLFEVIRRNADFLLKWKKSITYIAKIAFGIYFVHILLMEGLRFFVDMSILPHWGIFVVLEGFSFFGSLVVIALLSKVKSFERHLFLIKR